jgi:hypothetical protein
MDAPPYAEEDRPPIDRPSAPTPPAKRRGVMDIPGARPVMVIAGCIAGALMGFAVPHLIMK